MGNASSSSMALHKGLIDVSTCVARPTVERELGGGGGPNCQKTNLLAVSFEHVSSPPKWSYASSGMCCALAGKKVIANPNKKSLPQFLIA